MHLKVNKNSTGVKKNSTGAKKNCSRTKLNNLPHIVSIYTYNIKE
jgi:hypothetical protein